MSPTFGTILSNLIKAEGISQNELARRSGIPQAAISDYCTTGRIPRLDQAILLADAFGISLDAFRGSTEFKPKSVEVIVTLIDSEGERHEAKPVTIKLPRCT